MTDTDHGIPSDPEKDISMSKMDCMATESITDKMLFALGLEDNDNTLSLTIFEKGKGATICLNKEFAKYFVKHINHHIQLMK